MKRFFYIFLIKLRQSLFLGLFVFVPIGLLEVVFSSHFTSYDLVGNSALATGFLCVLVTAFTFRPEDTTSFEMQASLPTPLWRTVFETLTVSWGVVWLVGGISALASAHILDIASMATVVTGYAAIVLFFGGITLLGITAARDARMGIVIGLLAVAWMYAFPSILDRQVTVFSLFNILQASQSPLLWGVYRLIYTLLGIGCLLIGKTRLRDVDYLLAGTSRRTAQPTVARVSLVRRRMRRWTILCKPLPMSVPRMMGLIIYEGIISVLKGPIPIVIVSLWLIFGGAMVLGNSDGIFREVIEKGAISLPFTMRLFWVIFLPSALIVTASADRRTHAEQLMISILSPRVYMGGKLLGILGGVLASFLISTFPTTLLMALSTLVESPIYLTGYLTNVFLGVCPLLAYITALSVLTGMLVQPEYSLIWGGGMTVGILIASISTAKSVIGNIILPSGQMVADTIAYSIFTHWSVPKSFTPYNPKDFMIVPGSYLIFPILSTILQGVLMWFIASKGYERQVTTT